MCLPFSFSHTSYLPSTSSWVALALPSLWGPAMWRQGEECVKHPRKHELLFSHKYEKTQAMAVESFWRNQPVGWLLYSGDLDRGSGQGVVKAVVLGLKDLSWTWAGWRAADEGKNLTSTKLDGKDSRSCRMVPFGSTHKFLPFHFFLQASVGQLFNCLLTKAPLKKNTDSGVAFTEMWEGAESWNRREDHWRGPGRPS